MAEIELDQKALDAARLMMNWGPFRHAGDDQLEAAIRAYLAATRPVSDEAVELGPDGKEWAKTEAGYHYVESRIGDAAEGAAGLVWYGHVVREAFVAGAEWQEARAALAHTGKPQWQPIETAPKDGTVIEAVYNGDFEQPDEVFWQADGRHCVLGSRASSYPPGWSSRLADNLPVDEPSHWRHLSALQTGGETS